MRHLDPPYGLTSHNPHTTRHICRKPHFPAPSAWLFWGFPCCVHMVIFCSAPLPVVRTRLVSMTIFARCPCGYLWSSVLSAHACLSSVLCERGY